MATLEDGTSPERNRRVRNHPEPPRPCPEDRGLPLVGLMLHIRREGAIKFFESRRKGLGDVYRVNMGLRTALVVSHPDAFERALSGHKRRYVKGALYDSMRDFLGLGLVTLEGDAWKERRRLMQPYFHRAALESMVTTMVEVIDRFLDDLRRRYPKGGEIDVHREMVRLTLDVVCTTLFGPRVAGRDDLPFDVLGDIIEVIEARQFVMLPLWVPIATNRRFHRVKTRVDAMVHRALERARALHDDPAHRSTLLGMLLDTTDEHGRPLGDEAIRNELLTLYVAGHETTALTMTWLFALLMGDREVLPRMTAECRERLGERLPGFADLPGLEYTRMVIEETLRLRNITPGLGRIVVENDNVCGHSVAAGEVLMLWLWGLHRHEPSWPDPERFDPERFTPAAKAQRDPWSYLPFSGGPRMCIGNGFALAEAQLIVGMMMQRAEWETVPGQRIEPVALGTLRPSGPVRVRFRWR
jgi:cytochrome P450